jgi:spermidine/putrescine transport system substrate-binding protein
VPATAIPPTAALPAATSAPTVAPTSAPTAAPSAPATAAPQAAVGGSLTVLDWSGYDAADFWIDFKNTYPNVTMNFEIGASDADIYAKMKAGDQADIFHPYTGWLQFYVDEGLVEEIDTSKLTNWNKVPDNFKAIGQINGKQYFLPWDWGFTSILYRTDKVPEGVDSWAALMNPKYKGHISMWDDGPGARGGVRG